MHVAHNQPSPNTTAPTPPNAPKPKRYDVFLFSKPNTLLAWLSLPVIKLMQLRYVNDSVAAVAGKVS